MSLLEEPVLMSERVETLEDVKQWIAAHDGKIDAYWEAQHKWNDDKERELKVDRKEMREALSSFARRLVGVEKKLIWMVAACASAAFGGGALSQFFPFGS